MKRILLVCVEALMNTILYPETSSYRTLFSVDYTMQEKRESCVFPSGSGKTPGKT